MTGKEKLPGETVRGVMRRATQATLATTLAREGGRRPYASLVLVAVDQDASPLLLISDLADHSRNLAADPRLALLFDGTAGWRDPLAGPRASVLGRAEKADSARLTARFLARQPGAEVYAGFKDFHLYRVAVESAHLVAGFGEIHWLDAEEVLFDGPPTGPLAEAEAEIVAHMNQDHGEAMDLMATRLLGRPGAGWRMTGLDPEGCDLIRDREPARLDFDRPVADAEAARQALVRLTARARHLAGEDRN